ncbi:hypothetical protein Zm00014a_029422, partial [Zea mays]
LALLGAATVCWSIWLGRNELIFENKISLSPLQVIFTVAQRLRAWAVLKVQLGARRNLGGDPLPSA